jgi:GT2 family glycosyltransferase
VNTPEISVIICTRNRAVQVGRTLLHLQALRFDRPWELVLVDNGSSDGTWMVLTRFSREFDGSVILAQEPRRGLGRAHTRGLELSSAAIIAIIDDDCYPEPDYLLRLHECFAEEPLLGFLGGRILLYDPTDLPITIQTSRNRCDLRPGSFVPPGLIQGANMAFRRSALEAAGGFDVRLGPGTPFNCEDVDVATRISAAGWTGAYDPRPTVYHHHGRKTRQEARDLARSYAHGRGALYAKCLLDPRLRMACARYWAGTWGVRRMGRAAREVAGAAHYWFLRGSGQPAGADWTFETGRSR